MNVGYQLHNKRTGCLRYHLSPISAHLVCGCLLNVAILWDQKHETSLLCSTHSGTASPLKESGWTPLPCWKSLKPGSQTRSYAVRGGPWNVTCQSLVQAVLPCPCCFNYVLDFVICPGSIRMDSHNKLK